MPSISWKCNTSNNSRALFQDVQKSSQDESGPTTLDTMAATVALGKTLNQALWDRMPCFCPCRTPSLWLPGELFLDEEVKLTEKMGNHLTNLRLRGASISLKAHSQARLGAWQPLEGGPLYPLGVRASA